MCLFQELLTCGEEGNNTMGNRQWVSVCVLSHSEDERSLWITPSSTAREATPPYSTSNTRSKLSSLCEWYNKSEKGKKKKNCWRFPKLSADSPPTYMSLVCSWACFSVCVSGHTYTGRQVCVTACESATACASVHVLLWGKHSYRWRVGVWTGSVMQMWLIKNDW